ncbi:ATP-binding protein [Clostridium pasteurianum]|uniref:ATP-binding protein n=1 Tax=Clostridium pasteurianum TaxID=1501 RepID=UPI00226081D5|nr:ATP-binding protein [Clostridium pasteurianum]UZW16327.1 ATP-binding protein [Clostridium pasteurianum]
MDNSIKAAEFITHYNKLDKFFVSLEFDNSQFQISDNCGGISRKKVLGGALKIGSSLDYKSGHGIGLKRAFLKFGKIITITSNRSDYSCKMIIDVDKWGMKNDWDLYVTKVEYNENIFQGLTINIRNLYNEISRKFSDFKFKKELIEEISMKYRYKLQCGFKIIVNKKYIEPSFIQGDKVAESPYKVIDGMNIKVILYNHVITKENGWDIVINGRVILHRDKSEKTLWSKKLIKSHYSYIRFVGEVLNE